MTPVNDSLRAEIEERIQQWEKQQQVTISGLLTELESLSVAERPVLQEVLSERLLRQETATDVSDRLIAHARWNLLDLLQEYLVCKELDGDVHWQMGELIRKAECQLPSVRRVAYLGREGSWSWQKARHCFPDAQWQGVEDFDLAAAMVASGEVDAAVLPIDNTTAGSINEVYDVLLASGLYIVSGSTLAIRNHLLGLPGATVDCIREVRSHPQPIRQCSERIARGSFKAVPMGSTADAAASVKELNDPTVAAIGSQDAAEFYGLEVLETMINDAAENQTRFITVMRQLVITPEANRISLAFVLPHSCGSLAQVLGRIADLGLNLSKIQSRPIPGKPWEYHFYLDFLGSQENRNVIQALYLLSKDIPALRLLGWYEEQV